MALCEYFSWLEQEVSYTANNLLHVMFTVSDFRAVPVSYDNCLHKIKQSLSKLLIRQK